MYTLIVKDSFDAAHFLKDYKGKCAKIHGHTWNIEIEISGEQLDKTGMLIDFGDIKKIIKNILPDHEFLNEVLPINPTAENLSRYFYEKLNEILKDKTFYIKYVTIWESPSCGCRYEK